MRYEWLQGQGWEDADRLAGAGSKQRIRKGTQELAEEIHSVRRGYIIEFQGLGRTDRGKGEVAGRSGDGWWL